MESSIELLIEVPNQVSLLFVAPPTLQELKGKVASSTNHQESSISLLYNRKGNFFKIADNETYLSLLKKTIAQGGDEIEMKVNIEESVNATVEEAWDLMSNISNIIPEESKQPEILIPEHIEETKEAKAVSQYSLYYRYLNGPDSEKWVGIELDSLEILLLELSNIIVNKESKSTSE